MTSKKVRKKPKKKRSSPKPLKASGSGSIIGRILYNANREFRDHAHLYIILLITSVIFLSFGFYHLGKFFITDEIVWLRHRFPMYWSSVVSGDWSDFENFGATSGILQSILSGHVYFSLNLSDFSPANFSDYLFQWRAPLLIFNFLLLFFIFERVAYLLDKKVALLTVMFLSLFPYLIGISQIFNKDTTLWSTSFLAMLNFFIYIKEQKLKHAIYAGIFLGFGLLSKFPAALLYPCYFLYIYLELLTGQIERDQFKKLFTGYLITCLTSMLVVFLLLPACWAYPKYLMEFTWFVEVMRAYTWHILISIFILSFEVIFLKGVVSLRLKRAIPFSFIIFRVLPVFVFISFSLVVLLVITGLFDQIGFLQSGGKHELIRIIKGYFSGLNTLSKSLSICLLIGFIGFLALISFRLKKILSPRWYVYALILFFIYYMGTTISGQGLSTRYQMLLHPVYALCGAGFFTSIFRKYYWQICWTILLISAIELWLVTPFYISYRNLLIGKEYFEVRVNWGQGGYEIAQVANHIPNSENIRILTDYEGTCEFFEGSCTRYNFRYAITPEVIQQYDYLSLSRNGYNQIRRYIKQIPAELEPFYELTRDECIAYIGNKDQYVKLVRVLQK